MWLFGSKDKPFNRLAMPFYRKKHLINAKTFGLNNATSNFFIYLQAKKLRLCLKLTIKYVIGLSNYRPSRLTR